MVLGFIGDLRDSFFAGCIKRRAVCLGYGLAFLLFAAWHYAGIYGTARAVDAAKLWAPTPCVVVKSEIAPVYATGRYSGPPRAETLFWKPSFVYEYTVAGQKRRFTQQGPFAADAGRYKDRLEALKVAAATPVGSKRTCYVNPADPAQATISLAPADPAAAQAPLLVFLLVLAGCTLSASAYGFARGPTYLWADPSDSKYHRPSYVDDEW